MVELFLIGSLWFWVFLLLVGGVVALALGTESLAWAIIISLGATAVVLFGTDFNIATLWLDPWTTAMWVGSYVVGSVVWTLIKWWTLCKDELAKFKQVKDTYRKEYDESLAKKSNSTIGRTFEQYVSYYYSFPPKPSKHAEEITTWLMFWPLSIVGTFIGDYIYRFFKWVYTKISTVLQQIANSVFKGAFD